MRQRSFGYLLFAVMCVASCGGGAYLAGGIDWSAATDSLLSDTAHRTTLLDSLRQRLRDASADTTALDAAVEFGAELRDPAGDRLVAEVRDISRAKGYALGEAEAEYRSARIAVRQHRLTEADSLLGVAERIIADRSGRRWDVMRIKAVFSRADLKRYARQPDSALVGFRNALGMAQRINDAYWMASGEAALGASYLMDMKFDSARVHCERCVAMAQQAKDLDRETSCHNFLGEMYRIQERYDEAIDHQQRALDLAALTGDRSREAENLYALGEVYRQKDDFARALDCYQRAIHWGRVMGMAQVVTLSQLYTGDIHHGFAENDTALARYRAARISAQAAGIPYVEGLSLMHAAQALAALGRTPEALVDAETAFAIADSMNDDELRRNARNCLGEMLLASGRTEDAIVQFDSALALGRRIGTADDRFYAQSMGDIAWQQGRVDAARRFGEDALRTGRVSDAGPLEIAQAAELLFNAYRSSGEGLKAAEMLQLKVAMMDSVYNARQLRKVSNLELKAQGERLQAERERERAQEELRLASERAGRNLIAVIGGALLLLAIGLWSRLRYVRRTRDTILRTQEQLVESEKRREASEVRTRIARDVHDELGSEVTRITLLVGESRRAQIDPANKARMDEIASLTREVGSSLSDIVWAVDPQHDNATALVAHAEHYAQRMLSSAEIRVERDFGHSGADRVIDPASKRDLFLLLKEALNNALKYAQAKHIAVQLRTDELGYRLSVQDDGVGFDPAIGRAGGNGLANMRARSAALGAELRITASPGQGCSVDVTGQWT